MKKTFFASIFIFAILLSVFVSSSESKRVVVNAEILEPEIKFSAPSSIDFGQVTCGYESDINKIELKNLGTQDIKITVSNVTDEIFRSLKYSTTNKTFSSISKLSLSLDKSDILGEEGETEELWLKLDLSSLKCNDSEMFGKKSSEIIFWAMPD